MKQYGFSEMRRDLIHSPKDFVGRMYAVARQSHAASRSTPLRMRCPTYSVVMTQDFIAMIVTGNGLLNTC